MREMRKCYKEYPVFVADASPGQDLSTNEANAIVGKPAQLALHRRHELWPAALGENLYSVGHESQHTAVEGVNHRWVSVCESHHRHFFINTGRKPAAYFGDPHRPHFAATQSCVGCIDRQRKEILRTR